MGAKSVRAVIRRADRETLATAWFPLGSPEVIKALLDILPLNGENFMVIWQESEIDPPANPETSSDLPD